MQCATSDERFESGTQDKAKILKQFQSCFFATNRLVSYPWTNLEKELERSKSADVILELLKQTCLHSLCRKFPPLPRYRKCFLSELIRRVEAAGCEPMDELYDALAEVVVAPEVAEGYRTYLLPCGDSVSLLESVALISEGTTGLVTWEAALYLAEWALDHPHAFNSRKVLELGSGAGLTGIALCRSCAPLSYIFSDCHPSVLRRLRDNLNLNGLNETNCTRTEITVEELDWTDVTKERLNDISADVLIAADVVYDPEVVMVLVELLSKFLNRGSVPPEVLICSTVRNPETYAGFKRKLDGPPHVPLLHCISTNSNSFC
ncbi:protein-lysine N-methyltransferase EEF2KMT isoform X2 [Corythoichthys intestinalis]|uniref:protein-lysine N-methyltransferase EEF2KMT isoform X2 n=1 Tax=Corythoichthys intestinalis TaxID=161448 RepID=UPI0025A66CDA|nr:protein-lysine N-methyltransferase EEF2KMT isoform X2 [Corythoichthys intestinalis]